MAITYRGFDSVEFQYDETYFAKLFQAVGRVGNDHGVSVGVVTSAGAGTRQVSVSTGTGFVPGIYFTVDSAETVSFDANTSGTSRTDYVVVRADWVANTVALAVIKGATVTSSGATQVAGVLWEMPIARVTVRNGTTAILSTDIQVCKPLPRLVRPYDGSNIVANTVAFNSPGVVISSVVIPDPGYAYYLKLEANLRASGDSGYPYGRIRVDTITYATAYASLMTPSNGSQPLVIRGRSPVLAGQHTVDLMLAVDGAASGNPISNGAGPANYLTAYQIPA